jgi:hypothetical protein
VPDLDNCTAQDKRDAYRYLDLRVCATTEGVDIKGYLKPNVVKGDSCVLVGEQSSGCLISRNKNMPNYRLLRSRVSIRSKSQFARFS